MSTIEVRNLRKEYSVRDGIEVAVDGIDLTVEEGEFLSILGPSGCGKTTTLRCIAGLEIPTAGTIEFDGVDITEVPANKRNLAMMFQNIALYPHMSVIENIAYPLKLDGISRSERRQTAREAAETMQIEDLLEKKPGDLSGGQQQRAALARTIVQDPIAFLMDEPLSDLDAKLKVEMRKEVQRVHKQLGKPTIYVTHDQEEAITMSDRIVVLRDGDVEQIGRPREIYERPNNTFVASFVGNPSINYVDGSISGSSGDRSLALAGTEFDISLDSESMRSPDLKDGRAVLVGFRPQTVSFSENPTDGDFEATIVLFEPIDDRAHVTLDGPAGELRSVIPNTDAYEEGQSVGVDLDASRLYLFDPADESLIGTTHGSSPSD